MFGGGLLPPQKVDKVELEELSGGRLVFDVNDEVEHSKSLKCYETLFCKRSYLRYLNCFIVNK